MPEISDVFSKLGGNHVERMLRVLTLSYEAPVHWHLGHVDFVSDECDLSTDEARICLLDLLDLGYIQKRTHRITDEGLEILRAMGPSYTNLTKDTKG